MKNPLSGPVAVPYLKSLSSCHKKLMDDGYTDDFKAIDNRLKSALTDRVYKPEQVNVVNFFRFEGNTDPDDNAIMYVIETSDGLKGTLVDAYGVYADAATNQFMQQVNICHKDVH